MQETQVQSLGWEDPLEKEMATHFSTLAWKIPWTEEAGKLTSTRSQRFGLSTHGGMGGCPKHRVARSWTWLSNFTSIQVKHIALYLAHSKYPVNIITTICTGYMCMGCINRYKAICGSMDTGKILSWGSPGRYPGVGCHAFLQGIFPTTREAQEYWRG